MPRDNRDCTGFRATPSRRRWRPPYWVPATAHRRRLHWRRRSSCMKMSLGRRRRGKLNASASSAPFSRIRLSSRMPSAPAKAAELRLSIVMPSAWEGRAEIPRQGRRRACRDSAAAPERRSGRRWSACCLSDRHPSAPPPARWNSRPRVGEAIRRHRLDLVGAAATLSAMGCEGPSFTVLIAATTIASSSPLSGSACATSITVFSAVQQRRPLLQGELADDLLAGQQRNPATRRLRPRSHAPIVSWPGKLRRAPSPGRQTSSTP